MGLSPTRVQLLVKDPIGWRTCVRNLAEHPAHAAAKTLRTVQAGRVPVKRRRCPGDTVLDPRGARA